MQLDSRWYAVVRQRLESMSLINALNSCASNYEYPDECDQAWGSKSGYPVSEKHFRHRAYNITIL